MNVTLKRYVAYYRVSTKRQGKSGLGLEAQQEAVHRMAQFNGATIIAEYVEIETGKNSARPKLHEAIHHARLTNSTLVVAKLDRLARNCYFLNCLLHAELDFVCCDNPYADRFNIQVLAAVAKAVQGCLRSCDLASRAGGEEFVVVDRTHRHNDQDHLALIILN